VTNKPSNRFNSAAKGRAQRAGNVRVGSKPELPVYGHMSPSTGSGHACGIHWLGCGFAPGRYAGQGAPWLVPGRPSASPTSVILARPKCHPRASPAVGGPVLAADPGRRRIGVARLRPIFPLPPMTRARRALGKVAVGAPPAARLYREAPKAGCLPAVLPRAGGRHGGQIKKPANAGLERWPSG
jgi:hypothetical protein